MKTVFGARVRGCLLAGAVASVFVVASGCSGAAPTEDGQGAPHAKLDDSVSPQACINCPPPTLTFPRPPPDCRVIVGSAVYVYPAHYVVKLANSIGKHYYDLGGYNQRFADGYSIPFPSPWNTGPTGSNPDPYAYERALYWTIPSSLWWDYLVHVLTPPPPGSRIWTEDSHLFFLVGIPNINDYSKAETLAQQNTAVPVEAQVNTCVHVAVLSGDTLYDTGETFNVYDLHDPLNPPY